MKLSSLFLWKNSDIIRWRCGSCPSLPGISPVLTTDPALGLRDDMVINPLSCASPAGAELHQDPCSAAFQELGKAVQQVSLEE